MTLLNDERYGDTYFVCLKVKGSFKNLLEDFNKRRLGKLAIYSFLKCFEGIFSSKGRFCYGNIPERSFEDYKYNANYL